MNLSDWKAKWYPVPADECSAEGAIDHSILKWTGLLEKNREGLKVRCSSMVDTEGGEFQVNHTNCALCVVHYRAELEENPCRHCPLALSRSGVACDKATDDEGGFSPWEEWVEDENAQPMLEALHKAKAWMLDAGAEQVKYKAAINLCIGPEYDEEGRTYEVVHTQPWQDGRYLPAVASLCTKDDAERIANLLNSHEEILNR